MTTIIKYGLVSNVEENVIAANSQIELNSGIPCKDTPRWDIPKLSNDETFYWIWSPDAEGWNNIPKSQMMEGVVNVDEKLYDKSWVKPFPPPNVK